MKVRFLKRDERNLARSIFGQTIPLDDILITDGGGPSLGPVEPFASPTGRSKYCLAMGRDGFVCCVTAQMKPDFVRGLTYIWQRRYSPASAKAICGFGITYQLGQPWGAYSPEQQAKLVCDWADAGMLPSDPRASYISNHLRAGEA